MSRACSTHGDEEVYMQDFWCGSQRERDHQKDLEVDDRLILKWILEK
jgi:hypothetical protein